MVPKRRKKVLIGEIKDRLERIINEVGDELGFEIISLAVNPDNLHLWTHSYFCSTAESFSAETIQKHIEAQSKK